MFKGVRCLVRQGRLLDVRWSRMQLIYTSNEALRSNILLCSRSTVRSFQSSGSNDSVSASYKNGFVIMSVPLPSRQELCEFTLRPVSQTVEDLIGFIKHEDGGVDRAAVYSNDDVKISKSTPVELLMRQDFKLVINDSCYNVVPPLEMHEQLDNEEQMSDLKNLIGQLYTDLNLPKYQETREKHVKEQLEYLKVELEPLEDVHALLQEKADRRTNLFVWGGLAFMSVQFGFLARLTWWEYSWDIMEPVTYFITFGTSMACYAYYVLTRQDYSYPDARNRQLHLSFRKESNKAKFDWKKYVTLKSKVTTLEDELQTMKASRLLSAVSHEKE